MTPKQTAVMWLGLTLIAVRLFTTDQWKQLWATILKGQSKSSGIDTIPPLGPLLPIPEVPLISAPSTTTKNSSGGSVMV